MVIEIGPEKEIANAHPLPRDITVSHVSHVNHANRATLATWMSTCLTLHLHEIGR
jgi:hypothetical protein